MIDARLRMYEEVLGLNGDALWWILLMLVLTMDGIPFVIAVTLDSKVAALFEVAWS